MIPHASDGPSGINVRLRRAVARLRRPPLMPHEERQALIRKPFPITYNPPQKRWGGVQIINDEDWMRDANAWRKKYANEHGGDDSLTFGERAYFPRRTA